MGSLREDVALLVERSGAIAEQSACRAYYYPDIPDWVYDSIRKHISSNIRPTTVAAVIDVGLIKNAHRCLVFTTEGLYHRDYFTKQFFVRYEDVEFAFLEESYIRLYAGDDTYDVSPVNVNDVEFDWLLEVLRLYIGDRNRQANAVPRLLEQPKISSHRLNE